MGSSLAQWLIVKASRKWRLPLLAVHTHNKSNYHPHSHTCVTSLTLSIAWYRNTAKSIQFGVCNSKTIVCIQETQLHLDRNETATTQETPGDIFTLCCTCRLSQISPKHWISYHGGSYVHLSERCSAWHEEPEHCLYCFRDRFVEL